VIAENSSVTQEQSGFYNQQKADVKNANVKQSQSGWFNQQSITTVGVSEQTQLNQSQSGAANHLTIQSGSLNAGQSK
jgi:hypothetical protein